MHRSTVYVGSDDRSLYALAAATGAQRWRAGLNAAVIAGPALADGVVYAAVAGGQVAAVRESTGPCCGAGRRSAPWSVRRSWRTGWFCPTPTGRAT